MVNSLGQTRNENKNWNKNRTYFWNLEKSRELNDITAAEMMVSKSIEFITDTLQKDTFLDKKGIIVKKDMDPIGQDTHARTHGKEVHHEQQSEAKKSQYKILKMEDIK